MALTVVDKVFAIKAMIKTLQDSCREYEDALRHEMLEDFENNGTTQRRSNFFGKDAGTVSIVTEKEVPDTIHRDIYLEDKEAFKDWLVAHPEAQSTWALELFDQFSKYWIEHTGEVPDGIHVEQWREEGHPERPKGVRISVKANKIVPKMIESGQYEQFLLGGANGD